MIDVLDYLSTFNTEFSPYLVKYLDTKLVQYSDVSPNVSRMLKNIKEFTMRGGKRLRPALLNCVYVLLGGEDREAVMELSVFMELLQSYLLIHDDIFDEADLRRGDDTFHKIYEKVYRNHEKSNRQAIGNTMAILGGDISSQLVFDIIMNSRFSDSVKNRVVSIVTSYTNLVFFGQIDDYCLSLTGDYSEQDVLNIHKNKTCTYTTEVPVLVACTLVDVVRDNKTKDYLLNYATNIGMAFQIRDDILGVFGKENKTGKSSISDIKEGKKTLLTWWVHNNASITQIDRFNEILGKKNLTDHDVDDFKNITIDTGALKHSKKRIENHIESAKNSLKKVRGNGYEMEFLYSLADFILVREY